MIRDADTGLHPPLSSSLWRLRMDLSVADMKPLPRGAVGAFSNDGFPLYGYPEIAGYWLRWASARDEVEDSTGAAVISWLRSEGCWA